MSHFGAPYDFTTKSSILSGPKYFCFRGLFQLPILHFNNIIFGVFNSMFGCSPNSSPSCDIGPRRFISAYWSVTNSPSSRCHTRLIRWYANFHIIKYKSSEFCLPTLKSIRFIIRPTSPCAIVRRGWLGHISVKSYMSVNRKFKKGTNDAGISSTRTCVPTTSSVPPKKTAT